MPRERKVVLFGRTGDGKSTIANALVTGGIKPEKFKCSDGARGCTSQIQKETGRGWTVTDTVGIGEADSVAVPNADAKKLLTDFLKEVKDEYSHIIYVKKANKMTTLDEMIWLIFTGIFEGAEEAFVVLFTGASEEWLAENRNQLPEYLRNQTILVADIPAIHRLEVTERRRKAIRERSIKTLEANLVKLFEERGNNYSVPDIAEMTEPELEQKSRSILHFIVDTIKKLYDEISWRTVASKLGTLVDVASLIFDILDVAGV